MTKEITYKKQADGRDSWAITEKEGRKIIAKYMVYEDPHIDTECIQFIKMFKRLTKEQLIIINKLLK